MLNYAKLIYIGILYQLRFQNQIRESDATATDRDPYRKNKNNDINNNLQRLSPASKSSELSSTSSHPHYRSLLFSRCKHISDWIPHISIPFPLIGYSASYRTALIYNFVGECWTRLGKLRVGGCAGSSWCLVLVSCELVISVYKRVERERELRVNQHYS